MKSTLAVLSLAALLAFADDVHNTPSKRHHHHDLVARNANNTDSQDLQKRAQFSGVATWYDVTTGQGYCGGYRSPGDYVVALNAPQMESQSVRCGDTITISANGRTAVASVWDECPPCAWGSLDLSAGLFQVFGDLGQGVIPITWWTGGDPQPQPQQPTSTYVWTPDPTTQPPSTSSSTPSPTTSSNPSSTNPSSSSPDNTVQEVSTSTDAPPQNLNNANNAILQLAEILRLARNGGAA